MSNFRLYKKKKVLICVRLFVPEFVGKRGRRGSEVLKTRIVRPVPRVHHSSNAYLTMFTARFDVLKLTATRKFHSFIPHGLIRCTHNVTSRIIKEFLASVNGQDYYLCLAEWLRTYNTHTHVSFYTRMKTKSDFNIRTLIELFATTRASPSYAWCFLSPNLPACRYWNWKSIRRGGLSKVVCTRIEFSKTKKQQATSRGGRCVNTT